MRGVVKVEAEDDLQAVGGKLFSTITEVQDTMHENA